MKSNFRERQPQELHKPSGALKIGGDPKCIKVKSAQLVNINRAKKPYNPNNREMKIKIRDDESSYTVKSSAHEFMLVERIPLKFMNRNQKNIEGDYSFTVDGANTGGIKQNMKIRRLTPIECERLQGFPDGWTEGFSDTQRYKMMGNAVTVNVIKAIMEKLK